MVLTDVIQMEKQLEPKMIEMSVWLPHQLSNVNFTCKLANCSFTRASQNVLRNIFRMNSGLDSDIDAFEGM